MQLAEDGGTLRLRQTRGDDDHQLRVKIRLPRGSRSLDAHVGTGEFAAACASLTDVSVEVGTGDLRVEADRVEGTVRAGTGVGELALAVGEQGPKGGSDLRVGTGSLHLQLPHDAAGSFDCSVDTGGIEGAAELGLRETRQITSATARGTRGSTGPSHRVHVGVGNIVLR